MKKRRKYFNLHTREVLAIFTVSALLIIGFAAIYFNGRMRADDSTIIEVRPLVKTAYLQFDLRKFPNLPTSFFDPNTTPNGDTPLLEVPEVHTAKLFWKEQGTTDWKEAQPFVRVQGNIGGTVDYGPWAYKDPRMATMLFGLLENSYYDYKVEFSGDGFPLSPIYGSFKTKSTAFPHTDNSDTSTLTIDKSTQNISSAIKYYLNDCILDYGSDRCINPNNVSGKRIQFNGDSAGVKTIIRGLGDYSSSYQALGGWNSGEVARLQGTPENWLVIEGRENDNVVLDGSDPQFDTPTPGKWTECNSGNNYCDKPELGMTDSTKIYRTTNKYYYDPPGGDSNSGMPIDSNTGLRIIPTSIYFEEQKDGEPKRLLSDYYYPDGGMYGMATLVSRAKSEPEEGNFANESGYTYVHLNNGLDPNSVYMKIPIYKQPFQFSESFYIAFKNLTFQYFRGGSTTFAGSHDITYENVRFVGGIGVGSTPYANTAKPNKDIIINNSKFRDGLLFEQDPTTKQWKGYNWNDVKMHPEDNSLINFTAAGVSILNSDFIGAHDAITPPCDPTTQDDYGIDPVETIANYADFGSGCTTGNRQTLAWEMDNNYFKFISDDAVELRVADVGIAVTRNRFDATYKDISLAPIVGGPYYILRNISIQTGEYFGTNGSAQSPFKIGNKNYASDTAYKFIANNTLITANTNYASVPNVTPGLQQEGPNYNLNVFNNFIVSDNAPIQFSNEGASCYPQIFDNNLYMATRKDKGYAAQGTAFALVAPCHYQGDTSPDYRASTFEDWQLGKTNPGLRNSGATDYPTSPPDQTYHSTKMPWLHDPNGIFLSYNEGQAPSDYNLTSPTNALSGDFRPKSGTEAIAMGRDLANITYDIGPGWIEYAEPQGNVTVGAVPGPTNEGNITLSMPANTRVYLGKTVDLSADVTNATTYLWEKVNGPGNVSFSSNNSSSTNFTADFIGSYVISLTASNAQGNVAKRQMTVVISKLGDIDGKNGVGFSDFTMLLANWGTPSNPMADLNNDGTVDFKFDFTILLSNWG